MKKILVFGNMLVKEDSLALEVANNLRKEFKSVEFKELDALEEIQNQGKNPIILDVVKGIGNVIIIENLDQLNSSTIYTMHDFDLAMNLKLLKKLGFIESVKIIGIPINYNKEKAIKEIRKLISNLT